MVISGRSACAQLRAHGIAVDAARRALAVGLAGEPLQVGRNLLYDADRVRELAQRPVIQAHEVYDVTPRGLFLARVDVDLRARAEQQRVALETGWEGISPWVLVAIRLEIEVLGPMPLVATTGGFVTAAADVTDVIPLGGAGRRLVLAEPGGWSERFTGRRVRGGPGRPWELYRPPWSPVLDAFARGRVAA